MQFRQITRWARCVLAGSALWLAAGTAVLAQEVQRHGLVFEEWVRTTFFGGYQPTSYTQKWDIPASANVDHGGIPANPKAIKYGTPVDLGDALRQFEIDHDFLLILGFWEQRGQEKHFVNIVPAHVTAGKWRELWGPITYSDLLRLDRLIKDTARPIAETRRLALQMKNSPPFSESIIQLNPKIDANQRRLQCSVRFSDVFKHLAPEANPKPQEQAALWGVPFPGPLNSPPRK
jgi:hypothetical protein